MSYYPTVIIGAGPAGLTAGYELAKKGINSITLEKDDKVGGIARTETYKGYRFDIGGHRFYTKVGEVEQFWQEVLGNEFIQVPRLSRIYYDGKFFSYPLEAFNALSNLGVINSLLILWSYFKVKVRPNPIEDNFEQWVSNRFGKRLYETFFKSYTEKVWGIPCTEIRADWAAQRIQGLSLKKAILNSLFGSNDTKTLIKEFNYPILGPGMMWERVQEILESQGNPVQLNTEVICIEHQGDRITSITTKHDGKTEQISGEYFISSMPLTALIRRLDPLPPQPILDAVSKLKYRDFLIVALVINDPYLFPDNWIYIHSPQFKVGRIQNFKNWSPAMVPDRTKTCLGMEYFCSEGDALWELSDTELINLASREIVNLGLVSGLEKVEDGAIIRQHKAYPVYDDQYQQNLQIVQDYLSRFENLQTVGRNGMHRYNNQDHSMLTAMLAVRNICGEKHNLWKVNTERSYLEEFTSKKASGQREEVSSLQA
ncbi:MAG: NAD(P)/FAD-dependent oxidoreductase [Chloroflexaceae bacterium]|nr:NAD(P)/FAD-dependent oxidoreductase [Chloroflexaceae bacterium]